MRQTVDGSLRALIGNTPAYRLRHLPDEGGAAVHLKLEHFNPGGSVKDRTALGMIRQAELDGRLEPGMQIVESSSGNTAIGLAMLASDRDYRIVTICDRHLPLTKRARLIALGAEIVFLPPTPEGLDTVELRIAVAEHLARTLPRSIALGQYFNPANPEIHYRTTGPEIWRQMQGRIDAVVVATGTCGTISGVGRFLKEQRRDIQVIGVEPTGSVIFGGSPGHYLIQGGGLSFVPPILDRAVVDVGMKVDDTSAIRAVHATARVEALMIGGTGGLVVHAALEVARQYGPCHNVVGIIPDGGDRYLDTLFDPTWLGQTGLSLGRVAERGVFGEAIDEIGCSVNEAPPPAGSTVEDLCARLGVTLPLHAV